MNALLIILFLIFVVYLHSIEIFYPKDDELRCDKGTFRQNFEKNYEKYF